MDTITLWYAIRYRWQTENLMRKYAVRTWWPATMRRHWAVTESELRLMDGNR